MKRNEKTEENQGRDIERISTKAGAIKIPQLDEKIVKRYLELSVV